jgi:hypothetical protein
MPEIQVALRADGPHEPQYTAEVGNALAECVRVLNYATRDDAPGLEYAGDVYTLLGHLYTAAERLPQLLGQLAAFLNAQAATGTLADNQGRDPAIQADMAADELTDCADRLSALTRQLHRAQNDIAGLHVKEDGDG